MNELWCALAFFIYVAPSSVIPQIFTSSSAHTAHRSVEFIIELIENLSFFSPQMYCIAFIENRF